MGASANYALADEWKCSILLTTDTYRCARSTIGGTVARASGIDVQAVLTRPSVGVSTWKQTANTREYSTKHHQRIWRMAWTLRAI